MRAARETGVRCDRGGNRNNAGAVRIHRGLTPHARRPRNTVHASPDPNSAPTSTSTSAGAGATIQYRPWLSRKTTDPLFPRGAKATGLVQFGQGLWCLRQDLYLTDENVYINCPIIQLRSGGLMLVNPPMATEEAVALVRSVEEATGGRVEHVVIPSLFPDHWYGAADWAPHCGPEVTLWVIPGLLERRGMASLPGAPERIQETVAAYSRISELPVVGPLPGLEGEVESATFSDSLQLFTESALWFRDQRAVVLGDIAFGAYEHQFSTGLLGPKLLRFFQKLGCPFSYVFLRKDPQLARAWVERVLSWDVDKVLTSHLDPLFLDGARELRRCFEFVLAP